jgi:hypothetical protein
VLDLLLFLVKLPFILIGVILSTLSGLAALVMGLVGGLVSGVWSLLVSTCIVLLVVWLVVALLRRRRVKMV